jgi:hypothetical protein
MTGRDTWWNTDELPRKLERQLTHAASECVRVLNERQQQWKDPHWFLDRISPETLLAEDPVPPQLASPGSTGVPQVWRLVPQWTPHLLNTSYFLAVLSLRDGNPKLAREYGEIAASQPQSVISEPAVHALLDEIDVASRKRKGKTG